MEILEAYQKTLDAANELRAAGIKTKSTPTELPDRQKEDPLPKDKWVIIEFFPTSPEQVKAIQQKTKELGRAGIFFDMSGGDGQLEWEVDWSFHVDGPNDGHEAALDQMNEMINKSQCGPST